VIAGIVACVGAITAGVIKATKRKPPGALMGPFSIGLAFWQIISLFKRIAIEWPPAVGFMFDVVGILNMNIDYWQAECTIEMTYQTKMIAVVYMPLVACAFAYCVLGIAAVVTRKGFTKDAFMWWSILSMNASLVVLTVSFVSVVAKCFEVLDCTYLSVKKDKLVMKSLPEVECNSKEWFRGYLAVVCPVIAIYLIAPLALFSYLKSMPSYHIWDGSTFEYR
jgi:hypothetical protein